MRGRSYEGVGPRTMTVVDKHSFCEPSGWYIARPLRVQYCGAVYHVMARGNHGQPIFKDDKDRERFMETLAEAGEKTGWRIYAYVLMSNHYHLSFLALGSGPAKDGALHQSQPSGVVGGPKAGQTPCATLPAIGTRGEKWMKAKKVTILGLTSLPLRGRLDRGQVAGGGMGMRGGAVFHIRSISSVHGGHAPPRKGTV